MAIEYRTCLYCGKEWRTGDLHVKAYFAMWTADGEWQPGWVPSQADMLANDWREVIPKATP